MMKYLLHGVYLLIKGLLFYAKYIMKILLFYLIIKQMKSGDFASSVRVSIEFPGPRNPFLYIVFRTISNSSSKNKLFKGEPVEWLFLFEVRSNHDMT